MCWRNKEFEQITLYIFPFTHLREVGMKNLLLCVVVLLIVVSVPAAAQGDREPVDTAAIAKIKAEETSNSQVMDILSTLSDVYGPRLTGSPGYERAAEWVEKELHAWGLENIHREYWGPFGRGWSLKRYSANVLAIQNFPLISYPKAWSPGFHGTADVVFLGAKNDTELQTYKGKLHGKFVLFDEPREVHPHFEPEASRDADSVLLQLANSAAPDPSRRRRMMNFGPEARARMMLDYQKWQLCEKEGALAILTSANRSDMGTIFVQQATVPTNPESMRTRRIAVYQKDAPKVLPQISVGVEHYDRLVRMIKQGEHPRIEMELEVASNNADSVFNIVADLPGTDLKDEVVMMGGHFDSWHGGTGATDDGTGSCVALESIRLIKSLGLKPRRTIRIALWAGEEQGLLGSQAYVKRHYGERSGSPFDSVSTVTLKPDAEKFSVYFNHDNGGGKIRGVYMQGNESVRSIFRAWLAPFNNMGASTLTLQNTGGTDHLSFDAIGLPGFQFIQDELEYSTRTHHSTMDTYERIVPDDLKQGVMIMASFAYEAATRDERFPRKPQPQTASLQSR